jgi:shikimate kinase
LRVVPEIEKGIMAPRNIYLVGPMGSGKSTIGRLLAKALHMPFKDTDQEIEARTGADISWIFDVEGEEGFRHREAHMLKELLELEGLVLATGGGIVLRGANRQLLRQNGCVIYLKTTVEHQYERTAKDRNRPLLQCDDRREKLAALMEVRDPLYRQVADHVIQTDRRPPKTVVREILSRLSRA